MSLTANQIPLHEWPNVAASYMSVRLLLSQVTMPAPFARTQLKEVHRLCNLTDFQTVTNAQELVGFREYLHNLLLECEEELQ